MVEFGALTILLVTSCTNSSLYYITISATSTIEHEEIVQAALNLAHSNSNVAA